MFRSETAPAWERRQLRTELYDLHGSRQLSLKRRRRRAFNVCVFFRKAVSRVGIWDPVDGCPSGTGGRLMTARNYSVLAKRGPIKSARAFRSGGDGARQTTTRRRLEAKLGGRSVEEDDVWAEKASSSYSLAAYVIV